jgi:hypothetical protein
LVSDLSEQISAPMEGYTFLSVRFILSDFKAEFARFFLTVLTARVT